MSTGRKRLRESMDDWPKVKKERSTCAAMSIMPTIPSFPSSLLSLTPTKATPTANIHIQSSTSGQPNEILSSNPPWLMFNYPLIPWPSQPSSFTSLSSLEDYRPSSPSHSADLDSKTTCSVDQVDHDYQEELVKIMDEDGLTDFYQQLDRELSTPFAIEEHSMSIVERQRVLNSFEHIRQLASSMFSLAQSPQSDSSTSTLNNLFKQGLLSFAQLKHSHRVLQSHVECYKEKAIKSHKNLMQFSNLQIDNINYLNAHYRREIVKFRSFQPLDHADLIDEESFLNQAQGTHFAPGLDDSIFTHNILRLQFELDKRERLHLELEKHLPSKKSLWLQKIKMRNIECEKFLKRLDGMSNQLSHLQTTCNFPIAKKLQQTKNAHLLPLPLYNLFTQLTSWIEAHSSRIELVIGGDYSAAEKIESRESPNFEALQRMSAADLHKSHPSFLHLKFFSNTSSNSVNIRIEYLVYLNIVISNCDATDDPYILAHLYPRDSGEYSPNLANNYLRDEKKPFQILNSKGRAYKWLQAVSGLYFLTPLQPISILAPSFPSSCNSAKKNGITSILDHSSCLTSMVPHYERPSSNPTMSRPLSPSHQFNHLESWKTDPSLMKYSLTSIMNKLFKRIKVREILNGHLSLLKSGKFPVLINDLPLIPNTAWLQNYEEQSYLQAKELSRIIKNKVTVENHAKLKQTDETSSQSIPHAIPNHEQVDLQSASSVENNLQSVNSLSELATTPLDSVPSRKSDKITYLGINCSAAAPTRPSDVIVVVKVPNEFIHPPPAILESSSRFFKMTLAFFGTKDRACALIQVFADHPARIPVFFLYPDLANPSSQSIRELQKIELAINSMSPKISPTSDHSDGENQILGYQIVALRHCLETKFDMEKHDKESIFFSSQDPYTTICTIAMSQMELCGPNT